MPFRCLRESSSAVFVPDLFTYNTLIRGLISQDKPEDAQLFFQNLIRFQLIQPNVVTYNTIINGICKRGNPDVVTYNALMDGYCLRGEVDEALAVLETMKRRGIFPDTRSYNILINGYCKKLKVDRAVDILQQMPAEGLTPTIQTYNTILQGFFHLGRHVEARRFFKEKIMLNKSVLLSKVTCGILLHGLCQNRFVVEALSFFQMLECRGLVPDIHIYTILIDGLSKNGHLEKATSLFGSLPSKGLRPDVKAYTMMIQAFCGEGLLDKANELFVEMEANGCLPNDVTYNTLIRGCFHDKKYTEACVLIDDMRIRKFSADASTASMLLDLLESQEHDPALLALHKKFLS